MIFFFFESTRFWTHDYTSYTVQTRYCRAYYFFCSMPHVTQRSGFGSFRTSFLPSAPITRSLEVLWASSRLLQNEKTKGGLSSYAYVPADYPPISSCRLRTSCLAYYEIGHSKTWASKNHHWWLTDPIFRSYTESISPLRSYYGLSATRSTGWTEIRSTYAHTVPSITLETREKCRRVFSGIHRLVQRVAGNHE